MGGNALKVQTVRLTAEEFVPFEKEVVEKALKKFKLVRPTLYYKNKPTFGDLDVLVSKPKLDKDEMVKWLQDEFQTKEIYFNSDVVSFEYKNFQIDFIFVSEEDFEASHFYFSYNDLNNLAGRISHKLNLKLGFDGLSYIVRAGNGGYHEKVYVSKNPEEIYKFLDLDYNKFVEGFDELEDIFSFIISSKYFSASIFAYENLNHQNRTRNRKRKTYAYFLEWLINNNITNEYPFKEDKDEYIDEISEFFKVDLRTEIKRVVDMISHSELLSSKFNGKMVMELIPKLEGKELGKFLTEYKNCFEGEEWEKHLLNNSEENIKASILNFYLAINYPIV